LPPLQTVDLLIHNLGTGRNNPGLLIFQHKQ
jgi:hypothetical protein